MTTWVIFDVFIDSKTMSWIINELFIFIKLISSVIKLSKSFYKINKHSPYRQKQFDCAVNESISKVLILNNLVR